MNLERALMRIGISGPESAIYLDLLEHGQSNIVELSQRTKLHRPLIYKTLPLLEENRLVSKVLHGKRFRYKAESPERLRVIYEQSTASILGVIPDLVERYEKSDAKANIRIFEGKKGVRHIFEDIAETLKDRWTYLRYSSRTDPRSMQSLERYMRLREEKEIQRKVITSEERAKTKRKKDERRIAYIPKRFDLFDQNVSKMIYQDKVAIIDHSTDISFIIEDRVFAKFEEKLFLTLFKLLSDLNG